MKSLYDLIMARRSVRSFQDREIPAGVLDELLDAAVSAPSGGNVQPLSIIVIRESSRRKQLSEIVGKQPWVKNAPVSLVFCLDYLRCKRWASAFDVEFHGESALAMFLIAYADIMCAAQTVTLLAESHGLGSVYVGSIQSNADPAREMLDIPEYVLPMMILSLGYPRSIPSGIPKLPRNAMIHEDHYRVPGDEDVRSWYEAKYGEIGTDVEKYLETGYIEVLEADRQADTGWVAEVKETMQKLEIRSNAAFLFKLRYPTAKLAALNADITRAYRAAGFDCFDDSA
jgi:nitroreductase